MSTKANKTRVFRKLNCHPKNKTKRYTCYDDNTLVMFKNVWNQKYKYDQIQANDVMGIWIELQKKIPTCTDEQCWSNALEVNTPEVDVFAPRAPKDWSTNLWLSNDDIISVLKQYKEVYPNFDYLGPSTLDFDTMNSSRCRNILCKTNDKLFRLNIKEKIEKGINKLGISINFVKLGGYGEHWVTLFVDLEKKFIFYFDSCGGYQIPREIQILMDRIQQQCQSIGIQMTQHHSVELRHQLTKTECGMYSLYCIINLLEGKHTIDYFKKHKIPDKDVERYRRIYFN
jgi:hypothetical protein